MRRREFITLITGAIAARPFAATAQQQAISVIGFLSARSPGEAASAVDAFREGLGKIGYIEGLNVTIEYRWAEGDYARLPALAAELVGRQVNVIAATGGEPSGLAAKAATETIPIVFTVGGDPVELGLVVSLNKPGGNVTGVTLIVGDIATKRLGLLRQLVPHATMIAMLVNPNYPAASAEVRDVQAAARTIGLQIDVLTASTSGEIDVAFASFVGKRPDALFVGGDPFMLGQRDQIVSLVAHHVVPATYAQREFVAAGGLMSYGTSVPDGYRQAGVYTGRILRGVKPAELPVLQPTNLELAINLNTARTLGLNVPPTLLAIADEVIE
jgi:putative ABC transport system substrate-binding protein